MNKVENKSKLLEIIEHFGGRRAFCELIGVASPSVSYWMQRGEMPAARALEVEALSKGYFRACNIPTSHRWGRR